MTPQQTWFGLPSPDRGRRGGAERPPRPPRRPRPASVRWTLLTLATAGLLAVVVLLGPGEPREGSAEQPDPVAPPGAPAPDEVGEDAFVRAYTAAGLPGAADRAGVLRAGRAACADLHRGPATPPHPTIGSTHAEALRVLAHRRLCPDRPTR